MNYFTSNIVSFNGCYPFGMLQRNGGNNYRYSFQGQEKDDEIKGNSVNYKYRMHDTRLGRFFAVDPLTAGYPHYTPYSFSGNKVIHKIELEGLEESEFLIKGIFYSNTAKIKITFETVIKYDHNKKVLTMLLKIGNEIPIVYQNDFKTSTELFGLIDDKSSFDKLKKNGTISVDYLITGFKQEITTVYKELIISFPDYFSVLGVENIDDAAFNLAGDFINAVKEDRLDIGVLPNSKDRIKNVKDAETGELINKEYKGGVVYRVESTDKYKGTLLITPDNRFEITKLIFIYD